MCGATLGVVLFAALLINTREREVYEARDAGYQLGHKDGMASMYRAVGEAIRRTWPHEVPESFRSFLP